MHDQISRTKLQKALKTPVKGIKNVQVQTEIIFLRVTSCILGPRYVRYSNFLSTSIRC